MQANSPWDVPQGAGDVSKLGMTGAQPEGGAEGLPEPEAAHLQGCDLRPGKWNVRAHRWTATAHSQSTGAVVPWNDQVLAATLERTWQAADGPGSGLKAEAVEGVELVAYHSAPDRFEGNQPGD